MIRPKGIPFTYKGVTDVTSCKTAEEVMEKASLDWDVEKRPIFTAGKVNEEGYNTPLPVEGHYAVCRTDIDVPLGLVKDKYECVQNKNVFSFFNAAVENKDIAWQTAGCFNQGNKIFVTAKLPKIITVNGEDPVTNYLILVNSHDGSTGVRVMLSPIRVVCFNQLGAAIKGSSANISIKHTSSVHDNMKQLEHILAETNRKLNFVEQCYGEMFKAYADDEEALRIFGDLILNDKELSLIKETGHNLKQLAYRDYMTMVDANISSRKANIFANMYEYYFNGIGQQKYVGTMWGVYNAITGYYSNIDNADGAKRFDSLMFGDKARKIEKAGNLVLTH